MRPTTLPIAIAVAASFLISAVPAATTAVPARPGAISGDLPKSDPRAVAAFRAQADALYRMKEKAFIQKDPETIVNRFYARDAISFGPDAAIVGREQFRKEYEKVTRMSTVRIEPLRSFVGTNAAWDWTNFHVIPTNGQKPFTFMMVFLWVKDGTRWLCAGDAYATGTLPEAVRAR